MQTILNPVNGVKPFFPLHLYVQEPDDFPEFVVRLEKALPRLNDIDLSFLLKQAVARLVTSWNFDDPTDELAILLSLEAAPRLQCRDALQYLYEYLLNNPDVSTCQHVEKGLIDFAAQMGSDGQQLLLSLAERAAHLDSVNRPFAIYVVHALIDQSLRFNPLEQINSVHETLKRYASVLGEVADHNNIDSIEILTLAVVHRLNVGTEDAISNDLVKLLLRLNGNGLDNEVLGAFLSKFSTSKEMAEAAIATPLSGPIDWISQVVNKYSSKLLPAGVN